jgi:hypothetical protein
MKLTFDKKTVQELMDHAKAAPENSLPYDKPSSKSPKGLWLVGDQGIYLMSNGKPALPRDDKEEGSKVCYADQCNPNKMEFDDWWSNKREAFGGDDGVEFIPMNVLEKAFGPTGKSQKGNFLVLFLSKSGIRI